MWYTDPVIRVSNYLSFIQVYNTISLFQDEISFFFKAFLVFSHLLIDERLYNCYILDKSSAVRSTTSALRTFKILSQHITYSPAMDTFHNLTEEST